MALFRLAMGGAKKRPFYHIVAVDKLRARDCKYIERLGYFNPLAKQQEIKLLIERQKVADWVAKGAQLSDIMQTLLKEWDKQAATAA